jgi:hypothetical protein
LDILDREVTMLKAQLNEGNLNENELEKAMNIINGGYRYSPEYVTDVLDKRESKHNLILNPIR